MWQLAKITDSDKSVRLVWLVMEAPKVIKTMAPNFVDIATKPVYISTLLNPHKLDEPVYITISY